MSAAGGAEAGSRVFALTEFAADTLQAARQPGADTVRAARPALREMIPVWAGGAGLDANSFRTAFFGEDADPVDAYRMQRVTLAVMNGDDHARLKHAGRELADAVQGIGAERFPDVLAEARAQLVPVQADRAPAGPAAGAPAGTPAGASVVKVAASGAAPLPGVALPAVGTVLRGAATMLGSGAAVAAGAAAIVLWPKSLIEKAPAPEDMPALNRSATEAAAADNVVEARKSGGSNETNKSGASPHTEAGTSSDPPPPKGGKEDTENVPPAGNIKEASMKDLKKAASADGYDDVELWKQQELDLKSDSQIVADKSGNLYSIPRRGTGTPQPLNLKIPK